jgi:hypothetical protein
MTLRLPERGRKFRDANGRFRRKTVEDMGVFERSMYEMTRSLLPKIVADITRPSIFDMKVSGDKIGTSLRIRLPGLP